MPKAILGAFVVFALRAFVACGSNDATALTTATCTGACACSGNTCTCTQGGTCTLGGSPSAATDAGPDASGVPPPGSLPSNVTYHCDSKNNCDLTCGTGCTNT